MKLFAAALIAFFSLRAFGCPDVSGKYGGFCAQRSSCYGESKVYYGIEIKQKGCDELETAYVGYNGGVAFKRTHQVGQELIEMGPNMSVSSRLSYTNDGLEKVEKFGANLSEPSLVVVDVLKKTVTPNGQFLNVKSEGGSKRCKVKIDCVIPAL